MEVAVNNQPNVSLKVGNIVRFPQYGTVYVVHNVDQAALNVYPFAGTLQLYRLDGKKAYRKQPFTKEQLEHLVKNLGGEVYSQDNYYIELVQKTHV